MTAVRAQIEGETKRSKKRTTKRKQEAASPGQRERDVRDRAERATNQEQESKPEPAPGAAGEPTTGQAVQGRRAGSPDTPPERPYPQLISI